MKTKKKKTKNKIYIRLCDKWKIKSQHGDFYWKYDFILKLLFIQTNINGFKPKGRNFVSTICKSVQDMFIL